MATTDVLIFDTTLRDGEQAPGNSLSPEEKLRLARQLDALGVDVMEAGFPAASEGDYRSVREIAAELRRPVVAALARCHERDIELAGEAIRPARERAACTSSSRRPISTSRKSSRRPATRCSSAPAPPSARHGSTPTTWSSRRRTRAGPTPTFSAGWSSWPSPKAPGRSTSPIPSATPCRRVRRDVPRRSRPGARAPMPSCSARIAMTISASRWPTRWPRSRPVPRQVECTVNGIGERAGNAALEEIVMASQVRGSALGFRCNVDTREIYRTSQLLSYLTGVFPQPNKAIVGRNAFAHEAGIHQHGMLQNGLTYEIIRPEMVGIPRSTLVLGQAQRPARARAALPRAGLRAGRRAARRGVSAVQRARRPQARDPRRGPAGPGARELPRRPRGVPAHPSARGVRQYHAHCRGPDDRPVGR